jgi:hypothetical protein
LFFPYKLTQSDAGLVFQKDSKELLQQKALTTKKLDELENKKKLVKMKQDQILSLKKDITSLNIQFGDYLFANIKHFMKVQFLSITFLVNLTQSGQQNSPRCRRCEMADNIYL